MLKPSSYIIYIFNYSFEENISELLRCCCRRCARAEVLTGQSGLATRTGVGVLE